MTKSKIYIALCLITLVIGMALGTFFDLEISQAIVNTESIFGNFLEKWAEPPILIAVGFAFCCSGVYFYSKNGKKNALVTGICYVASVISLYSTITRTVKYYSETTAKMPVVIIMAVAASIAITALFIYLATKIPYEKLYDMRYAFAFLIASALAALVIISAIKIGWGRIRYRELLAQGDLNAFVPWYLPKGGGNVDGYKSFPSGHTSNATLLFAAAYMIKDGISKKAWKITNVVLVFWVATVMFSRMICGAHFLTDVCAGAIFTVIIMLVCKKVFYKKDL